ncbi:MAG: Ig-like domain-containing protein, partial [Calditrichaceae bacterium]
WNGAETITFTATDPDNLFDSDAGTITVTAVNDAPVVTDIPDQSIAEGASFATISLDDYVSDVDNADNEMIWSVMDTVDLVVSISPERVASIIVPDENWFGSESIKFIASDPDGASDTTTVTFMVDAVNDSPVLSALLPDFSFNEDDSLTIAISTWFDLVADPDNADSVLTYSVLSGKFLTVKTDSLLFVFKAPADWFGSDTLMLKISDGELADSAKFAIKVNPLNDAPYFTNLPDTVEFINNGSEELNMKDFYGDIDSPESGMTWQFSVSDDTLKLDFDSDMMILTLSAPAYIGTVTLYFTLTDDSSASVSDSLVVKVTADPTGIEDIISELPTKFVIGQNYPNPFNPNTHIRFGLPYAGEVRIEVYNILGQKVATIFDGYKPAGYHVVDFHANQLSSGIYFYRIESGKFNAVKKMVIMK